MVVANRPVSYSATPESFELWRYPTRVPDAIRGGVVALGTFDGIHRGHQAVFSFLKAIEPGAPTGVLTFYPHPMKVLRPVNAPALLSTIRERYEVVRALGVSYLYALHFSQRTASMSAEDFIADVLVDRLGIRHLVVGKDAAIGKGREGDVAFLQRVLPQHEIGLHVVPEFLVEGSRPSSREIRRLVGAGDVAGAAALLGRPFAVSGRVVRGDARGRTIGFPTANLQGCARLVPPRGVYAARVVLGGTVYPAVVNIGTRPTFQGSGDRIEAHLFSWTGGEFYGARIQVGFVERIRDEHRFASREELVAQIRRDCEEALNMLSHGKSGDAE